MIRIINTEMAQISKYPINKQVYERILEVFSKTLINVTTKNKASLFINNLFTPTERVMLAKRLAISFLLEKGYPYREISKILRVSTSTIGWVSLLREDERFRDIIKEILKDEKMEEFWLKVGDVITTILASGKSKSGTWIYLRDEIKKKRKGKAF